MSYWLYLCVDSEKQIMVCAKSYKDAAGKFVKEVIRVSIGYLTIDQTFAVCMLGNKTPVLFNSAPYLREHGYHETEEAI